VTIPVNIFGALLGFAYGSVRRSPEYDPMRSQ